MTSLGRRPLSWLVLGLTAVLAVLALRHHLVALTFPYPIAYGEGVIAQWLVDPGPLYPADPEQARHNPYLPAGYALAGGLHALLGDAFLALRGLALVGLVTVAAFLCVGPAAGRPWRERVVIVALVVLAPLWWRYGSLGRFDAIAVACSLGAACCAARPGWRWLLVGAAAAGLAVAIKPTAIAGLVAVAVFARDRRRVLPAMAVAAGVILIGPLWAAVADAAPGRHLGALNRIGFDPVAAGTHWLRALGRHPVLLVVLALFLVRGPRDGWWAYALAAVLAQVAALKTGAEGNYQLELLVAAGVAAARLRQGAPADAVAAAGRLALVQLCLYLPVAPAPVFTATYGQEVPAGQSALTPGQADREVGAVLADEIEAADDPLLSDDIGYLVRTGRPVVWQPYQFEQLRRRGAWSDQRLHQGVADKRYGLIILRRDGSWFSPDLRAAVADTYVLRREVGPYLVYAPDFGF